MYSDLGYMYVIVSKFESRMGVEGIHSDSSGHARKDPAQIMLRVDCVLYVRAADNVVFHPGWRRSQRAVS